MHTLKHNLAGHTADPKSLCHDRFDRHAAGQATILVRHLLDAHVHELISHCNHTLIVQQCVLFLALFNIMAKTSSTAALAFRSRVFCGHHGLLITSRHVSVVTTLILQHLLTHRNWPVHDLWLSASATLHGLTTGVSTGTSTGVSSLALELG